MGISKEWGSTTNKIYRVIFFISKIQELRPSIWTKRLDRSMVYQNSLIEDEKIKLRLVLEQVVQEQVGECSTIEAVEISPKKRPTCGNGRYIGYGSNFEYIDTCTFLSTIRGSPARTREPKWFPQSFIFI